MSTITLHRSSAFRDAFRGYRIIIDGTEVGSLARGRTLELPVTDGQHRLYAQIDWQKSDEIVFNAGDAPLDFEVFSKLQGVYGLFAFAFMFIPKSWIGIRPTPKP